MSSNDRDYIVGSTVKLVCGITEPLTRAPIDPPGGVALVALVLSTSSVALPTTVVFTKVTPGEYVLSLQTVGFLPGVYTWRARATDANGDVALSEDTFVLRSAA